MNYEPPIIIAAKYGYDNIVALYLQDPKIDVNEEDEFGETALHHATREGSENIARALLADPRVDVSRENVFNETALNVYLASEEPTAETVTLFLERGAYTEADIEYIQENFPEVWEQHQDRFYEAFEALDQGPLARQASILSSLVAGVLFPFVPFFRVLL